MYFKNLTIVLLAILFTANSSKAYEKTAGNDQKPSYSSSSQILKTSDSLIAKALQDYEYKWAASEVRQISLGNAPAADVDSIGRIDEMQTMRDSIISIAKQKLGAPYHFGSRGPKSFDCSGFASYVYKQAGIKLLRSSREQYKQGEKIEGIENMCAGDLVFFARKGNIYHVGIVVSVDKNNSDFKFIHASYSGIVISDSAEPYYKSHYFAAKRILI